jgi:hypothetical protein
MAPTNAADPVSAEPICLSVIGQDAIALKNGDV